MTPSSSISSAKALPAVSNALTGANKQSPPGGSRNLSLPANHINTGVPEGDETVDGDSAEEVPDFDLARCLQCWEKKKGCFGRSASTACQPCIKAGRTCTPGPARKLKRKGAPSKSQPPRKRNKKRAIETKGEGASGEETEEEMKDKAHEEEDIMPSPKKPKRSTPTMRRGNARSAFNQRTRLPRNRWYEYTQDFKELRQLPSGWTPPIDYFNSWEERQAWIKALNDGRSRRAHVRQRGFATGNYDLYDPVSWIRERRGPGPDGLMVYCTFCDDEVDHTDPSSHTDSMCCARYVFGWIEGEHELVVIGKDTPKSYQLERPDHAESGTAGHTQPHDHHTNGANDFLLTMRHPNNVAARPLASGVHIPTPQEASMTQRANIFSAANALHAMVNGNAGASVGNAATTTTGYARPTWIQDAFKTTPMYDEQRSKCEECLELVGTHGFWCSQYQWEEAWPTNTPNPHP